MTEPIDILEALLFASDTPVEAGLIQDVLELESADHARELVQALRQRLAEQGRPLQVIEVGGGFRMVTRPEVAPWLVKLARSKTKSRLSRPALETLAIIAYRQPVSRPEVDATRGVNSEGVLDNLLERRLIRIAGRKDSPGRPFLYETTREFLVAFGLRDLNDLPKVDGELTIVDPTAASAEPAAADGVGAEPGEDGDEPVAPDAGTEAADPTSPAGDPDLVAVEDREEDRESTPVAQDDGASAAEPPAPPLAADDSAAGDGPAASTQDDSSATSPPQQDPVPGGTDVAPRS